MESRDTISTSAAAAINGIEHDTATHDATAGDENSDDADTKTATYGNERDADAPNSIWSTATATTAEKDATVRGVEYILKHEKHFGTYTHVKQKLHSSNECYIIPQKRHKIPKERTPKDVGTL